MLEFGVPTLARCFSSSGAHDIVLKDVIKDDIAYVSGTLEDHKANLPSRLIFNERFVPWINKWLPTVDICYFVRNDRESKGALYYWLGKATL